MQKRVRACARAHVCERSKISAHQPGEIHTRILILPIYVVFVFNVETAACVCACVCVAQSLIFQENVAI